eukprot:COSAG06_NODE_5695_length_3315_cov_52.515524_2_plen_136_part_00
MIKPKAACVLSFLCLPGSPLLRCVAFLGFRLSFRTVPKGFAILSAVVGIALLIYSGIAALGYVHWTDTLCPQVRAVRPIKLSAGCCYPFFPIKLSADRRTRFCQQVTDTYFGDRLMQVGKAGACRHRHSSSLTIY